MSDEQPPPAGPQDAVAPSAGGQAPERRRIGVYVCHCGGNISDYVDVDAVVAAAGGEADVVVARQAMFTCSDATQQEIADDIAAYGLDGLVVASCSPKLHQSTFREVARRSALNPYEYTQVNIREQCSWTHTDDRPGATDKAVRLVRAGIARTRLSEPLEPTTVETTARVLVVGGGVAGMRAAIALADVGLEVFLVERTPTLGGVVADLGAVFPHEISGASLVARLSAELEARPAITVWTGAELVERSGTYGNYRAVVRVGVETLSLDVGQVVVATGFDSYAPAPGEFGRGATGVLTLAEFDALLDGSAEHLSFAGRTVESIAYIYCVGSRNDEHSYCSRYCCTAAVHASVRAARLDPSVRQYHCYRDLRTYGRNELLLSESRRTGSRYLKFADDDPPVVEEGSGGHLQVRVHDLLSSGDELTIPADLVVLVTGMVPRHNEELVATLKLPIGRDGFFNEIHPKLRPVETVVDGVSICGSCQGPKSIAESVSSGLAAAAHAAAVLKTGRAQLDPQIATVQAASCTGCGECVPACPFGAIALAGDGASEVARIDATACKGCGGCVPVCPADAIDLKGYTDVQIRAMIDSLLVEVAR